MTRRCTNPYFLSKLAAEVEVFRSGREAVVFRPSYVVGPGDGLVTRLLEEMASGEVVMAKLRLQLVPAHVFEVRIDARGAQRLHLGEGRRGGARPAVSAERLTSLRKAPLGKDFQIGNSYIAVNNGCQVKTFNL